MTVMKSVGWLISKLSGTYSKFWGLLFELKAKLTMYSCAGFTSNLA